MNTLRELNVEELDMVSGAGIGPIVGGVITGIGNALEPTEGIPIVGAVTGAVDDILGTVGGIVSALP
ncbi:hypothetical protein [Kosakonia radicincitans]|uniref:hypothetical protein n=1 Tax=Kosakonia radicincitans TaxID=283686 RepID=UPI0005C31109|nr:hypothetical protein [Kosakonia radicincitans]KIS42281.1 hypothetical protein LG58_4140 [Kosakonia radicincitans YD4]